MNLKELYKQMVAYPLPDMSEYIPTNVFNAATRCSAVRESAVQALGAAVKSAYSEKNALLVLLRNALSERSEQDITGMIPEGYSQQAVAKLVQDLREAKDSGETVRIAPRLCYRAGYRPVLTGSCDILIKHGSTVSLVKLSKTSGADLSDEISSLLYVLLGFVEYPADEEVDIQRVTLGDGNSQTSGSGLRKQQLTEPAGTTIERILGYLDTETKTKGPACAECIHAAYCPVLKAELQQEVENAAERDN